MSSLNSNLYEFGEFRLDPQSRILRRAGTVVPLTPKAFDVLFLLIQNAGRIVTKDELMKAVWPDSFVEESNLTQTIFMVRKALDETTDRRYILTVQGQGYRFLVPVTASTRVTGRRSKCLQPFPTQEASAEVQLNSHGRTARHWRAVAIATAAVACVLIVGVCHLAMAFAAQPC